MTALLGNYSLAAAALAATIAILASVAAARFASRAWLNTARTMIGAVAALLALSSAALLLALVHSDFSLEYVGRFTEQALPVGYKLAAFWAGQEGSMLLWAVMLAVMSVLVVLTRRKDDLTNQAAVIGALSVVLAFFIGLMLFVADANPFRPAEQIANDGGGLNPLLQNPWMIAHPPMLFLGYATFTVPFAFLFASLATGRRDSLWTAQARRWVLAAWLFLGVGIILGSVWAYVELNWGGYWGWDPVENASLLPWLVATALVHSLIVQQQRGMFKRWAAGLASLTFLLCIFAAWVTRSGLIQSVHAFAPSIIGTILMVFMLAVAAVMLGLIVWRNGTLRSEHRIDAFVSREGAVMGGNLLLLAMTALTMGGTLFPLLSSALGKEPANATPAFYNFAVLPLALALAAIMAVAPALTYGTITPDKLKRNLMPAAVCGLLAVGAVLALGIFTPWALAAAAVVGLTIGGVAGDMIRSLLVRIREGENAALAVVRMLDGNHRRYGGWVVHLGVGLIVAGVAGSGLFRIERTVQLNTGESAKVGRYTITFHGATQVAGENYRADEAAITATDESGQTVELRPQVRRYAKAEELAYVIALNTNWREDLHLSLLGFTRDDGQGVALKAVASPLVLWLWIGGLVLVIGGAFCLLPPLLPQARPAVAVGGVGSPAHPASPRPATGMA